DERGGTGSLYCLEESHVSVLQAPPWPAARQPPDPLPVQPPRVRPLQAAVPGGRPPRPRPRAAPWGEGFVPIGGSGHPGRGGGRRILPSVGAPVARGAAGGPGTGGDRGVARASSGGSGAPAGSGGE